MKKTKFNLGFTLLAASALSLPSCASNAPLTADNDVACRDRQGKIVPDRYCNNSNNSGNGSGAFWMFMYLSSNQYNSRMGHYPQGYNPRAYAGKTTSGFAKSNGVSRGGFGSSSRGMSVSS